MESLPDHRSRHQLLEPLTTRFPGFSRNRYFAQGLVVGNGWQLQNPNLNGHNGIMAYLSHRRLSIALVGTDTRRSAREGLSLTGNVFAAVADYLTRNHPSPIPTG